MPLVGAVQVCPHEPQLLVVFKSVQVALQQSCPELQFETQVPLVGLHCKHWLLLQGAARQVEPHTLAVAQQLLFRQVWPEGQAQVSLQAGRGGHTALHVPFTQFWPSGQTFPQAPQLLTSLLRSLQWPLQHSGVVPVQVAPQVPQFCVVVRAVHVPLQQSCPEVQRETQVPLLVSQLRHWLLLQGAARQVEPHTLAVGQQLPFRQVALLPQQVALL